MDADRADRLRRAAGPHRAVASAGGRAPPLAGRGRLRGRQRCLQPAAPGRPRHRWRSSAPTASAGRRARSSAASASSSPRSCSILGTVSVRPRPRPAGLGARRGRGRRRGGGRRRRPRRPRPARAELRARTGALGRVGAGRLYVLARRGSPRCSSARGSSWCCSPAGCSRWRAGVPRSAALPIDAGDAPVRAGGSGRAGLDRAEGRRAVLRWRLRDHSADAGRRRPHQPLDDERPVPERGRARPDHPGPGGGHGGRGRLRGARADRRGARGRGRLRAIVRLRPAGGPAL